MHTCVMQHLRHPSSGMRAPFFKRSLHMSSYLANFAMTCPADTMLSLTSSIYTDITLATDFSCEHMASVMDFMSRGVNWGWIPPRYAESIPQFDMATVPRGRIHEDTLFVSHVGSHSRFVEATLTFDRINLFFCVFVQLVIDNDKRTFP